MEKNTVLSPRRILESIYECEPSDLQFSITLNPTVERIVRAMESYAQQFQSPAPLSAEESVAIEQLYDVFANWYHDDGSYCNFYKSEAAKAFNAYALTLLSQRQPVAPEREEADVKQAARHFHMNRIKAMEWFDALPKDERWDKSIDKYGNSRNPNSLTSREIEAIWRKEGSPSAENKGGEG